MPRTTGTGFLPAPHGGVTALLRGVALLVACFGLAAWSPAPFVEEALNFLFPEPVYEPDPERTIRDSLYGVDMLDETFGVAVGYFGSVQTTSDGGQSWTHQVSGSDELLRRVDVVSETSVWAVGHRGTILHSSDAGVSWGIKRQPDDVYLRDIAFANERVGWAVGHDARILKTVDGGEMWEPQALAYAGRDLPRLHAVAVISPEKAVIAGEFGVFAVTNDGGLNWHVVDLPIKTTLTALAVANDEIVAVGLDGVAVRVGGQIFDVADSAGGAVPNGPVSSVAEVIPTGTKEHIFDVALDGRGHGGAVGRTVLLRFDGTNFGPVTADDSIQLNYSWYHGASILPGGDVVAVGLNGSIIRFDAQNPAQLIGQSAQSGQTRLALKVGSMGGAAK